MNQPVESQTSTVTVRNESSFEIDSTDRWADIAHQTLEVEGVHFGHLDLFFVDVSVMSELNATHMGLEGPTDVLAFPMDTPPADHKSKDDVNLPVHLGDIVICPEVAIEQAPSHCGSLEAEFCLLTVHAVLHILGHDHVIDTERVAMQQRERVHLLSFGFRHPEDL